MTEIQRRRQPRLQTARVMRGERQRRSWTSHPVQQPVKARRMAGLGTRVALLAILAVAAAAASVLAVAFPFALGLSPTRTAETVVAACVVAGLAVATVPLARAFATKLTATPPRTLLVFAVALLSAGAGAIHFAVVKMHFDEYVLFGVFFVAAGVGQLVWPLWLLLSGWRPLLVFGAVGNGGIAALWGVDRLWGLPLGPTPWTPDPVGFGDAVSAGFELLLVGGCVALLLRGRGGRFQLAAAAGLACAVTALTALSLLSVVGISPSVLVPTA